MTAAIPIPAIPAAAASVPHLRAAEYSFIRSLLAPLPSPVICDLGAYHGESTSWLAACCASFPRIAMAEADPRNVSVIKNHLFVPFGYAADRHLTLFEGAIADHTGTCPLYLCHNQYKQRGEGSSSICRPTGHLRHFPQFTFDAPIEIPCITLDDFFRREGLNHADLLWVDIQGAENQMVAAGREALGRSRYMYIEAEEVEMYAGQSVREELLRMLDGWVVMEKFEHNLLLENLRFQGA